MARFPEISSVVAAEARSSVDLVSVAVALAVRVLRFLASSAPVSATLAPFSPALTAFGAVPAAPNGDKLAQPVMRMAADPKRKAIPLKRIEARDFAAISERSCRTCPNRTANSPAPNTPHAISKRSLPQLQPSA